MRQALLLLTLLLSSPPSIAGGGRAEADEALREEAKRRMKISFDYDEVSAELSSPASAPAPPRPVPNSPAPRRAALPLRPNSSVQDATVYRDRALVTRLRALDLAAGEGLIDFSGLPLGIRPESLHAGIGAGDAEVLAVERLTGQGLIQREAEQKAIREELRPLVDRIGEARDRIEALLAQRSYLRGAVLPEADVAERTPVAEMERTLAFVALQEVRIAADLRKEEAAVEEIDRSVAPLLTRLADPLAEGERVRVRVRAARAGKVTVTLRYQVWGASWSPAYRARIVGPGKVELDYAGVVAQATGEDWSDARLLLSTADAATPGAPPQIGPWWLGEEASGAMQAQAQSAATHNRVPGAGADTGTATGGRSALVFEVPGRWTVRGDGSEQRVPVASLDIAGPEERVTVPRSIPLVYRSVRATHTGTLPLLAGPVSLFVGPDMVAQADLPAVAPGEPFVLHFGADEGMKVERTLVHRHREAVGPGRKTTRWSFEVEIAIRNFGGEARSVEVLDQLPVAVSDRVTVRRTAGDEPESPREGDPEGLLRWSAPVAAGGTTKLRFSYTVTSPSELWLPELAAL